MKLSMRVLIAVAIFFTLSNLGWSQAGGTAVPFLLIPTSVESNGMAGIMSSVAPTTASAMEFNPAQAGMLSRTHFLSSDIFTQHTQWLPQFHLSDLWIDNSSVMAGVRLDQDLPFRMSLGIGYSKLTLNLGQFILTSEKSPDPIGTFKGIETSDAYTLGVGLDFGFTVAFGVTVKNICSELAPFGSIHQDPSVGKQTAADYGIIIHAPLHQFLLQPDEESLISPQAHVTAAYAINNLGGKMVYVDAAQADPLPRTARLGWSVDFGALYAPKTLAINLISFTIAREAEDILATRFQNGMVGPYKGMFGDLNIFDNLIKGSVTNYVTVRRGMSVQVFDTYTYRQGSVSNNPEYTTQGYTVSTKGLFKLWAATIDDNNGFNLMKFILQHIDIRISRTEYKGVDQFSPLDGTIFNNAAISFLQ